ncbi:hypothetical protein GCM10010350_82570 [Streptomyces galilaeus]|nr:hypothetical protein GCM10010350_82570 [Streptomyces galilaeus]
MLVLGVEDAQADEGGQLRRIARCAELQQLTGGRRQPVAAGCLAFRAAAALYASDAHQSGLQGREPGAAYLLGARMPAQELCCLELGIGDVRAHDRVRPTDAPVDGIRQRK